MHLHQLLIGIAAVLILGTVFAHLYLSAKNSKFTFANVAEGTVPEGNKSYLADAAFSSRFLLGKIGSDTNHVAVCTASDIPLGIVTDEAAAAEDLVNVAVFGASEGTRKVVAGAAITLGDMVVPTASGKVIKLPTAGGTYYIIGRCLLAAGADGDVIEIAPSFPVQRVVT